jgi:bifunctional polynucleotide phosphatase/kinase
MWTHNKTLLSYTPSEADLSASSASASVTNNANNANYAIKGIHSFDFDHTLVCQKSGKQFPVDQNDWMPMYTKDLVKNTLIKTHNQGYLIVIFTNQSGVERNQITVDFLKHRIQAFIDYVGIPMYVFASLASDHYRKPSTEMWEEMTRLVSSSATTPLPPLLAHLYVGDAAGREKNWKSGGESKDFSCSDRKFAHNIGIEFQTPEEYFLNETPTTKWEWGGFNPITYVTSPLTYNFKPSDSQELILLIGPPASGKSTFVNHYLSSFTRINRDTLKTKAKCIKETKLALMRGESVVIDNTNPDVASRKEYIDIVKKLNLKINIIVIVIVVDKPLVMHLNELRVKMTKGETKKIPSVCYNIYYKKYSQPTLDEGITSIIQVPFKLKFDNDYHKTLFMQLS